MYMDLREGSFMVNDSTTVVNEKVAMNLKRLAREAGVSIYELADVAGINKQTLYSVTSGHRNIGIKAANAVSVVLGERLGRKPSQVYAELTGIDSL